MPALSRLSFLPRILNPVLTPAARHVPPLAVIHHRGRRTGRPHETPVQAYPTATGYLVGLAYDANAQWALNLLAAGGGEMTRAGQRYTITAPRRRGPEACRDLPRVAALAMRTLGIGDFLEFEVYPTSAAVGDEGGAKQG